MQCAICKRWACVIQSTDYEREICAVHRCSGHCAIMFQAAPYSVHWFVFFFRKEKACNRSKSQRERDKNRINITESVELNQSATRIDSGQHTFHSTKNCVKNKSKSVKICSVDDEKKNNLAYFLVFCLSIVAVAYQWRWWWVVNWARCARASEMERESQREKKKTKTYVCSRNENFKADMKPTYGHH